MASVLTMVLSYVLKSAPKGRVVLRQVRFYPRWSHRRPIRVYAPEELEKTEKQKSDGSKEENLFEKYGGLKTSWDRSKTEKQDVIDSVKYKIKSKNAKKPMIATYQKSKVKSTDMLETVIDQDGNFIYTKMKNNDSRVGSILTDIKSKKEKTKEDFILLEGKRLIKDALQSGCVLKYLLFSRKDDVEPLKPFLPKVGSQLYKMPYQEMQMWSDLTTTPGIMGIFKIPNLEEFTPKNPLPLTIICDNIREPGNLGTILRICAAVGCERVILTKGCVNLWDTKVLRSSAGAHFKLRVKKNLEWEKIEELIDTEGNVFIADNKIVSDEGESSEGLSEILGQVPLLPYYGVSFHAAKHLFLIVGGETLGISKKSYEVALRRSGARLNIPLSNNVDSLNVGAALGVIVFEIKKQLMKANK